MAQAMTLESLVIHCDTCGHEFPGKVEDWHHKACPECGAPGIIDDADVVQYRALMDLAGLVNGLLGDVADAHAAIFKFDSAAAKRPAGRQ